MKRLIISFLVLAGIAASSLAQTDAVLRLRDERKKHPEICSISFPGTTIWREAYDAIYGHGIMIENRSTALRVYMNETQAIDVYLKQKPDPEIRRTSFYTTATDRAAGMGCDVLRVGSSIGAGSFRGYADGSPVNIAPVASRSQSVLNDSTILIAVCGWQYGGHNIDMEQRITAHAATDIFDIEITLIGAAPTDLFCTGIQKLDIDGTGSVSANGTAISRGANTPDSKQPESIEAVELEVNAPASQVIEAKEDALNYLIILRPNAQGKIRYSLRASRPTGYISH